MNAAALKPFFRKIFGSLAFHATLLTELPTPANLQPRKPFTIENHLLKREYHVMKFINLTIRYPNVSGRRRRAVRLVGQFTVQLITFDFIISQTGSKVGDVVGLLGS